MNKRSYNIKVRLTQKEYEAVLQRAEEEGYAKFKTGELNLSAYIRSKLFSGTVHEKDVRKELRELNYQVRKIGVNINQAVKRINSGYENKTDDTFLLTELAQVERLLKKYEMVLGEKTWQ